MPRTIRFHLDEHCDPAIAAGLRLHGVDVTTTPEAGLLNADDKEHITYGVATDRVIFTQDQDFLRIAADWRREGRSFVGVALAAQGASLGRLADDLELPLTCCEPGEVRDRVI